MNGSKDSPNATLWLGIILPIAILAIAVVNVVTGCVWVPTQQPGGIHVDIILTVYRDGWRVTGAILFELGVAIGLFTWYFLADRDDAEKIIFPCLCAAAAIMCAGIAIFVIGFF